MSPSVAGLRERKKQDKLVRIEQAARELFSEHGYDKTSTRKIADRAGIGVGTLFVYFPTKRDLMFHLFASDVRAVKDAAFADVPDQGTFVDRAMFVFERFFDYYGQDPGLSRVFVKELGFLENDEDPHQLNELAMELMNSLGHLITQAQQRGEVDKSIVPVFAAYTMFSSYFTALVGWLGGSMPIRETQLAMLRGSLQMLYRGLAPR